MINSREPPPLDSQADKRALLSVLILTYNSASTLAETLESLLQQDYPALEVIACDDGSRDGTAELLQAWAERHRLRFARILVLTSAANQGICRNLARGYAEARGEWCKPIAGDDALEPNALSVFMRNARGSRHAALFARMSPFSANVAAGLPPLPSNGDFTSIGAAPEALLARIVLRNFLPAPGALVRRQAYRDVGGIDLSFRHLDDWPLWIRLLERGATFGTIDEALVRYRVENGLTTERCLATRMNRDLLADLVRFYERYQQRRLTPLLRLDRAIHVVRWRLALHALRDFPALYQVTRLLHALSPLAWCQALRGGNRVR
jgi:glycosyltransferase involved in cell wall biosynthesis